MASGEHQQHSARSALRVGYTAASVQLRERGAWALEALLARAGVREWELVADESAEVDVRLTHDPAQWEFAWDAEPDAERDPLAATFWWLARVEEQLAPEDSFDEHGRFRYDASALARRGDPFAAPVDDLAAALAVGEWRADAPDAPAWGVVPTHDIDLPWRWTRSGRRRALRLARERLRSGNVVDCLRTLAAFAAIPYWWLRRDDPWCNAHRIRQLEWSCGARSTSYLLAVADAPEDGDPRMHERGRGRYIDRLILGTDRRRPRDGGAIGLHGSYGSSVEPTRLARERAALQRAAGGLDVVDHRFHYLRHRPIDAWPQLAAAGLTSDATLGYAEQPGFRAGTASPYRAWDHERDRPLDLVVIPLALMDASLEPRYLDLDPRRGDGAALVAATIDRIRELGGTASVLVHNDRLCTVDADWTRPYRALLRRVRDGAGSATTARAAAVAYRATLPPARRS